MKRLIYTLLIGAAFGLSSCEKNDPITDLGDTNGEFSANISVSYSNTKPLIGDSTIVTVQTWQRDDKFDKVEFYQTIFESFGLELRLNKGTSIDTKDQQINNNPYSTLILSDTIKSKEVWNTILAKDLDQYWVTSSNNYVIRAQYKVERIDGKYPSNANLISALSDVDFGVLKSLLAYGITKDDYLTLFPSAPADHFTTGGTYVLTTKGMDNLRDNLTREQLKSIVKSLNKKGTYNVTIDASVKTPTGAVTSVPSRLFENTI
ncbi:hypothetical protein [Sphingobacterium yanglingense]|uniref:Uncharacterized protein n=1 Tax=Sphingobacterium yanglingense TaxID=1437280 RepID=A0A4R6WIR5_9SPHI|nr:hypothetical protein [Sphingobacterium yanglingense]TDQ75368.1 hypothetical protein CLV99_3973 [Sphingobacterium yanglingense]